MAGQEGIKVIKGKNGKTRYQAQVWYDRKFITSKTFDSIALARAFRTTKLEEAVKGTLLPAAGRREQRKLEAALCRPMHEWAELYVKANPDKLGDNRLYEYDQVGRLLGDRTMRDFSGRAGGKLIAQLGAEWQYMRFVRGKRDGKPYHAPNNPIEDQTLRLRLSALDSLIGYAMGELPDTLRYVGPEKPRRYAPPPAHANKRKRLPSIDEFAALLKHFGIDSGLGEFLRVIEETGCRLSEVSLAQGASTVFYGAAGHVLGGVLTLHQHKTVAHVGPREIPLSRYAAQILRARKSRFGDGPLFPDLPVPNEVCKAFDAACTALDISNLQTKDFRREFITRNVRVVPALELMSVVGQTSLIDIKKLSAAERQTQNAVGHARATTTQGYVTPELQAMAQAFTGSSRWPAVASLLCPAEPAESKASTDSASLERELQDVLARMKSLGLSTAAL